MLDLQSLEKAKSLFISGLEKLNSNNFIGAEIDFQSSLKFTPNRLSTIINLSIVLIKIDKLENAKNLIYDGLVHHPKNKELLMGLVEINEKLINLNPDYVEAYFNLGNALNELNMYEEALEAYNASIILNPDFAEAIAKKQNLLEESENLNKLFSINESSLEIKLNLSVTYLERANILKDLKRLDDALASYTKAIVLNPDYAEAYSNRGIVLRELTRLDEAIGSYDRAIEINNNYAEAYSNRGIALKDLRRFEEALISFERAIEIKPDYVDAYSNRGNTLKDLNRLDEALASYNQAIKINPNYAEAYYNRGVYFYELDQLEESLSNYDQAIKINHDYAEAYSNRGNVLKELKRFKESIHSYNKAIELKPNYAEALSNLGIILYDLKCYEESLLNYDKAIELRPEFSEAHFNKSILLLTLQDFDNGWRLYEWRWKTKNNITSQFNSTKPKLIYSNINSISNKKILIWAEQGVGDQILFTGMLDQLFKVAPESIIMLDKRLLPLFERSIPQGRFIDKAIASEEIEYEYHLPIADLGRYFRTCPTDFDNSRKSFLKADHFRSKELRLSLIGDKKYLCGITWSSKIKTIGKEKSIHLEDLLPILTINHIAFINLQYGDVKEQLSDFNKKHNTNIQECLSVDNFNDLDGHAALIEACDFVVTISNTSAHISGAIGKETYLMCPAGKGLLWYWCNQINGKSLWYPNIHIYEQNIIGQWFDVVHKIKLAIENKIIRIE